MKLGIISWFTEDCFKKVKQKGLDFIELCVNSRTDEFLNNIDQIKEHTVQYDLPIQSVGRWGSSRINKDGINQEEIELEYRLIDATAAINCGVYVTGCNYVEELSYYENCTLAIRYFERLIEYGRKYNIKIATYNCRGMNFVCDSVAYKVIHGYLKGLYIKYDPSHCIYAGGDYMQETKDWGERFAHVHLKGVLVIGNKFYDTPPAGMDMINWPALLGILYAKGYNGGLSIEPESPNWKGELEDKGINKTIQYFREIML